MLLLTLLTHSVTWHLPPIANSLSLLNSPSSLRSNWQTWPSSASDDWLQKFWSGAPLGNDMASSPQGFMNHVYTFCGSADHPRSSSQTTSLTRAAIVAGSDRQDDMSTASEAPMVSLPILLCPIKPGSLGGRILFVLLPHFETQLSIKSWAPVRSQRKV